MEKYYTTKQVAKHLNLDITTIYRFIKTGKLKAYKLGGDNSKRHWRIKESDLTAFIESSKVKEEQS